MNTLGNILWFIFGGFFTGLGYAFGGLMICLTVIGLPFGIKAIQFGFAMMTPFNKEVRLKEDTGCLVFTLNVVWFLLFGWGLALMHMAFAIVLGITIVGIPFARQHLKLVPIALLPFSYRLGEIASD